MADFKVGDRVRFDSRGFYAGPERDKGVGTVVNPVWRLGATLPVEVKLDGQGIWYYKPEWLTLTSPLNKGDKVVAIEGNDHLGIKQGVVYTVLASHDDGEGTILNVKSSSGRRAWADSKRFKQYVPKPQVFELRYGDKVKNLHTGRVGQVFRNSRGELYVYDTVRPIRDGVPAAALEGYEDEYPGAYDIVFRRDSEEPY